MTTTSDDPQINRETSSEASLGLQYKNQESQQYPDTQESAVEVGYHCRSSRQEIETSASRQLLYMTPTSKKKSRLFCGD